MTLFDYLVVFVLVCSIIISMMRGAVREVLSLLSWIVAFFVASNYCDALAALLPESIPAGTARLITAFLLLFIGVKILMSLFNSAIAALVKASGLTAVDRGLGSLFGAARGLLLVVATVLLSGMTAIPQQPFWKDALLSPTAESAALATLPFLPGAMARNVRFLGRSS
ncbi:MAG: CvpA family protein [Pseudomonadota bacterium]